MRAAGGRWGLAPALACVLVLAACVPRAPEASTRDVDAEPATAATVRPTPTSPPASPPPTAGGQVGYLGCSMTLNAVEGYHLVGGERFWPYRGRPFGGGTVGRWARDLGDGRYWDRFGELAASVDDTQAVWWMLCTMGAPGDLSAAVEDARTVLDEVARRLPGAAVYVSAQPAYADGHVCRIAGERGPEHTQALAERLVAEGLVLAGPAVGPLPPEETRDGCHANEQGMRRMGDQLAAFFGGGG